MDPATIVQLVTSISSGLAALATVAPEVAEVFTGGASVEELTAQAIAKARALPTMADALDADLEERKNRG